ncbi:MAG: protein tyrosine phosphatase [Citrobacter freundii]|nr:MAG: protein tyrosine phosphatase [Citrobacter freundii]
MNYFLQTIVLLFTAVFCTAQDKRLVPVEKISWHQLGDKRIIVKTAVYGKVKNTAFINLHHNEYTSLLAAKNVLAACGGILINIENNNERFISFSMNGRIYRFDPNRIFTEAGIKETLRLLNKSISPAATKAVRRFASFMKAKIPSTAKTIVALHNNEDGDLSIDSYTGDGDLRKEAQSVHQSDQHDADNFFLTTSAAIFRKMKKSGYNVVLQHNKKATDDGSLSVYYGRKKKTYVNVEAELGRLTDQQQMLNVLINAVSR